MAWLMAEMRFWDEVDQVNRDRNRDLDRRRPVDVNNSGLFFTLTGTNGPGRAFPV